MNNPELLSFLVDKGIIDKDQRRIIEIESSRKSIDVEKCILDMHFTNTQTLSKLIGEFNNEVLDVNNFIVDLDLIEKVPYTFCLQNHCIPITLKQGTLYFSSMKPDMNIIEGLNKFLKFSKVKIIQAPKVQIYELIQKHYAKVANWIDFIEESDRSAEVFIDRLFLDAVNKRASDIHFSCEEFIVKVRYRIDGDLKRLCIFHKDYFAKISVRLKIIFSVDITTSIKPRDGSLTKFIYGEKVDFRISFHNCIYGENIVIRILSSDSHTILNSIGYSFHNLQNIKRMITTHGGLTIFMGPTGSGKTTSLYAALKEIDPEKNNIMTVEDPVEYNLKGIQQIDINLHPDLNFPTCLRSILRQDPDVILIGEIRDTETAQMALRAAMTGHKVFTTLHAKTVLDVLDRLEELNLPRRLAAYNIRGVVAQRLIKKICQTCRASGCSRCEGLGYYSRCIVAESIFFEDKIIEILLSKASLSEKRCKLSEYGYKTILEDGMDRVEEGLICKDELVRSLDGII